MMPLVWLKPGVFHPQAEWRADMGDKGGKKDKEKSKQQQIKKHKDEELKKQDKSGSKAP
jgi:hypothetical protein